MVIYVTNIWNHYNTTVCEPMVKLLGEDNFRLLTVCPVNDFVDAKARKGMKWDMMPPDEKWVVPNPKNMDELENGPYIDLIEKAEVAVIGALHPCRKLLKAAKRRYMSGKLTYVTNERFFKQYMTVHDFTFANMYRWWRDHRIYSLPNMHYLPINYWAYRDMRFYDGCHDRIWHWAYFPHLTDHPTEKPEHDEYRIGWCGRYMELKHVDHIVEAMAMLPEPYRRRCRLSLIGEGETREKIEKLVRERGLQEQVEFKGYVSVSEVRKWMEGLDSYIFPSDVCEGWGVVLAEAMDKCCVPISCIEAGATLDLIDDGENGFVFAKGDCGRIARKLVWLMDHPEEKKRMGLNAWQSMRGRTPQVAAERLVSLIKAHTTGDESLIPKEGICSKWVI